MGLLIPLCTVTKQFFKPGADQYVPGYLNFFHMDMYVCVSTTEAINN